MFVVLCDERVNAVKYGIYIYFMPLDKVIEWTMTVLCLSKINKAK